ncbi:hypothetical protein CDV36_001448 [Fusarium kuroshium]|uniref:Uncharacterized protein n=1 Tax=Fusarium kuroshium TaxID=2010991 RepID=A0A3M2SMU1_9HYPO|nr:hypothetical protein CDV36_001448 [Fusarium kuroshium]
MDKLRRSNISLYRLTTILLHPINQHNNRHTSNPKASKPSKSSSRSAAQPAAQASPPQKKSTAQQPITTSTTSVKPALDPRHQPKSSSRQAKTSPNENVHL